MSIEVVCCVRMKDSQVYHHLIPIAQHPDVSRIWVVRAQKVIHRSISKAEYITVSGRLKLWQFIQMIWHCIRLARRKEVKAFVSFNPIPYGLFGWVGAKVNKKAMHFGFVGLDWNHYIKKSWGRIFLPILRRGDLVTVPGESMRQELLKHGFDAGRVKVLLHSIDIERFPVTETNNKKYCCIYVGELSRLKQVDIIIKAFAKIHHSYSRTRLCIIGDGPLRQTLEQLTGRLNITEAVNFTGLVDNVQPLLASAKMVIIASESEGFPFALVEGMCSGLVPVSTPVGAIPDIITDGENGLLFANGDIDALAECIKRLLDEPELYNRLREKVIEQRPMFSHDAVTSLWDNWFNKLA